MRKSVKVSLKQEIQTLVQYVTKDATGTRLKSLAKRVRGGLVVTFAAVIMPRPEVQTTV